MKGTVEERFWAKVEKTATCWLWMGARISGGYGSFWVDGRRPLAHRLAYEMLVGPVPPGLVLDHLCRVRHCVNPAHMEPVTNRENIMRGNGVSVRCAAATHCPAGHAYEGENLIIRKDGSRRCRACARLRSQRNGERLRLVPNIPHTRRRLNKNNTSGVKGVSLLRRSATPWRAQITVDRQNMHLGLFATEAEAVACRRAAELQYFGELCEYDVRARAGA